MAFDPNEPLYRKEVEQEVEYEKQSAQTVYEFIARIQTSVQRGHRFIGEDGMDYTAHVLEAVNNVLVLQKISSKYLEQIQNLIPVR
jgi:hypothetical protein